MLKNKYHLVLTTIFIMAAFGMAIGTNVQAKDDAGGRAAYVGAKTCKGCHKELYEGCRSTMHPYKFQDVSPDRVIGDFQKNNTLTVGGHTTKMIRKGESFFIAAIGPDNKEHTYRVKYLIGAFWKQMYVTEFSNGELHVLPAMWIAPTKEWVDAKGLKKHKPGDGKYWSDKTWIYQYKCSGCHNTGTRINYDEATDTFKTTWADKGVTCEACHGPGSSHVKAGEDDKAGTIVNPGKIPDPERAAMVCGSCHTRGSSLKGKYGHHFGYRPGKKEEVDFTEKPKLNPDGTSKANRQQYIDWKKSGHARAGVLCWDCHFVHQRGNAGRFQTKLPGSSLCRSCHHVENKGVHGIHSVNNCIGCHMPLVGKRAVNGDVAGHQFKVISPAKTITAGGPGKQPNSCNLCHYHSGDAPEGLLQILKGIREGGRTKYLQ